MREGPAQGSTRAQREPPRSPQGQFLGSASGFTRALVLQGCFGDCLKGTMHLVSLELWDRFPEFRFDYLKAGRDLKKSCSSVIPRPISYINPSTLFKNSEYFVILLFLF